MPAPSDPRERDNPPPPLQLSTFQTRPDATRTFDYTQKYPVDAEGKELDHDSRAWKVYIDEHESYDYDMVKTFRDNIDALLVFAALFSSVVTGFVVPAAERLEPDNAQISTSILFEATQLLRANGNATLIEETPRSELRPDSITHTAADVCVAWMFFASLALSLATALISILAKQWLQAFTALVPGDAKQRSLTRQFRFTGMKSWKFAEIVGFLPLLLHLSLFLFFIGLCIYVQRFHWSFRTMVGFVSLCAFVFYVVTAALPAVYLDCPYRIQILFIPASACIYVVKRLRFYIANPGSSIQKLHRTLSSLWSPLRSGVACEQHSRSSTPTSSANGHEELGRNATTTSIIDSSSPHNPSSQSSFVPLPLSAQERQYVEENARYLEFSSLGWLFTQSTNASVQHIAIYALTRALEQYVCCGARYSGAIVPPPSLHLEEIDAFVLSIINDASGPRHIADDFPHFLDFYIHSSHVLHRTTSFPASQWPSLIESPHLLSFIERQLLDLHDIVAVGDHMDYPLHIACRSERWDLVEKYFDEFDSSLWKEPDSDGWLPLGIATRSKKISTQLWKDVAGRTEYLTLSLNKNGDTAFHLICHEGVDLAKLTSIEELDWLDIQRRDGRTPLHCLCSNTGNSSQRFEIAKHLLSKGADLAIVDSNQWTPLHLACSRPHSTEFIEPLCSQLQDVENGRDILNQPDNIGRTALHWAVHYGKLDSHMIQALISAGADPNIVDNYDELPLHTACDPNSSPRREIIAILLAHTSDVNKRKKNGDTPLDGLMEWKNVSKGWQDMYELMREKGAKHARELEPALEETDSRQKASSEVEQSDF